MVGSRFGMLLNARKAEMEAEKIKTPKPEESRRGFLKKSGKVAAGAAILPIVMSLSADKARACGSGRYSGGGGGGGGTFFRFFRFFRS
jgi:hypothetical protein